METIAELCARRTARGRLSIGIVLLTACSQTGSSAGPSPAGADGGVLDAGALDAGASDGAALDGGALPGPSVPVLGACQQIAGTPDLGPAFNNAGQEPVDFGIWQAADGSWQLWSCIRGTKEEGNTRLFYRWEGAKITDANWAPKGIAMRAGRLSPDGTPNDGTFDPSFGEQQGGLQAPYVWSDGKTWHMVYGTYGNIGEQTSTDGKTFVRLPRSGSGNVGIFDPAADSKRDPMFLPKRLGDVVDRLYFTANSSVMLATTSDGTNFSAPKVVAVGGKASDGGSAAECPFVVHRDDGYYYLFRTSSEHGDYQPGVMTYVYASSDPTNFGLEDDSRLIAQLPIAAPEIHSVGGADYLAHLLPSVQGIEVCDLTWQPH